METIDDYIGCADITFRDMRLIKDPADYAAIGGSALLDFMLEGFKLVPFPYIGTLQELPVEGAYEGPVLFDIEWADDGTVAKAVKDVLDDGWRTGDIADASTPAEKRLGTVAMGDKIVEYFRRG